MIQNAWCGIAFAVLKVLDHYDLTVGIVLRHGRNQDGLNLAVGVYLIIDNLS